MVCSSVLLCVSRCLLSCSLHVQGKAWHGVHFIGCDADNTKFTRRVLQVAMANDTASAMTSVYLLGCIFQWLKEKERYPHATEVVLKSDQGPHYKSKVAMAGVVGAARAAGIEVSEWLFTEPGSGKTWYLDGYGLRDVPCSLLSAIITVA